MTEHDEFLARCVYYPCSALHGAPVEFLGKTFRHFLYADCSVGRRQFDEALDNAGFKGYRCTVLEDLAPENLFGLPWEALERQHATFRRGTLPRFDPFIALSRFERLPEYDASHGPEYFDLMFCGSEAIATFKAVFSRRGIAPQCLVHIRAGIGCGGNFPEYPNELKKALVENAGGLPAYLFHDRMGSDPECGDYLDLVKKYEPIESWDYPDGGWLKLARLKSDGEQGAPADGPRAARSGRR